MEAGSSGLGEVRNYKWIEGGLLGIGPPLIPGGWGIYMSYSNGLHGQYMLGKVLCCEL